MRTVMMSTMLLMLLQCGAWGGTAASAGLTWQDSGPWRLSERPAPSPSRQMAAAAAMERRGNVVRARREYGLLLSWYPDSVQAGGASVAIARCLFLDGRNGESLEQTWKALRRYPEDARAAQAMELAAIAAKAILDEAMALKARKGTRAAEGALEAFGTILRLDPMGTIADDATYYQGLANEFLGRYDAAAERYRRTAESYPDSPHASTARARLGLVRTMRSASAINADSGVLKEAREAIVRAGQEAAALGDSNRFGAELAQVDSKDAEKKYRRGIYYQRQGKLRAARVYLDLVAQSYPGTEWAKLARQALGKMPGAVSLEEGR